ncbi:hypothetical protein GCM10017044_16490 [Kordiimonas sediminis]|uniref:Ice-binding protein C-terminal domain-containing protein n=1 Tax=Kordiimonas sediminis TaxID=1735581 RepID=A0A919AS79_9PROT|nr:PEPxxWA-CTERM sorting domain-containing protein [Kordiimonas sediminis]GHF22817.1 hypothetical protein GCM10017044_16490 [Kordiimonas sediminis]
MKKLFLIAAMLFGFSFTATASNTFIFDEASTGIDFNGLTFSSGYWDLVNGSDFDNGDTLNYAFGTSAGGSDLGSAQYTNTFGFNITNVSGLIFGKDFSLALPDIDTFYVTLTPQTSTNFEVNRLTIYGTGLTSIRGAEFTSAVPEPATWLMMILGFGLIGVASRRRKMLAA